MSSFRCIAHGSCERECIRRIRRCVGVNRCVGVECEKRFGMLGVDDACSQAWTSCRMQIQGGMPVEYVALCIHAAQCDGTDHRIVRITFRRACLES
eukprot:2199341-Rhodomonas_salina.3